MGAIIQPKQKKNMIKYIKSNLNKYSQREIARQLNIGKTTVNRWCVEELNFKPTKHTVNENFFDELNELSSYILGFIFADGGISWNPKKHYWSLTITSSAKDKEHIEKIRKLMKSTKPLLYAKSTNSYRLIITNKILCQKLMELGVIPRKSLTLNFPEYIPKSLLKHFIRGIIDGDGNVRYVNRKRSPYFEITIASGSKTFIRRLGKVIFEQTNILSSPRKVGKNTYILQYSCNKGKKLANWIYLNSNIYLKRKFKIVNDLFKREGDKMATYLFTSESVTEGHPDKINK